MGAVPVTVKGDVSASRSPESIVALDDLVGLTEDPRIAELPAPGANSGKHGAFLKALANASLDYEPDLDWRWTASTAATRPESDPPLWQSYLGERLSDLALNKTVEYPDGDALRAAWNVADGLLDHWSPTPSVVPGDEGTVDLVWQRGGWHVELEIGSREVFVWARDRETGETWSGDLPELRDLLMDLFADMHPPEEG